eukprot:9381310-Heterocapsa_arctica.AAC.1
MATSPLELAPSQIEHRDTLLHESICGPFARSACLSRPGAYSSGSEASNGPAATSGDSSSSTE